MSPSYFIAKFILVAIFVSTIGLSLGRGAKRELATLYVATNGNDNWSGRLSAPNPNGSDGPLRTIPAARDRIRAARQTNSSAAPVNVSIREGVYRISEPLVFGPKDSGDANEPVTYGAYPGEQPQVSGGRVISGWKKGPGNLWRAEIPAARDGKWPFRELFVDGRPALRARTPNPDADPPYFRLTGAKLNTDFRTQTLSLPPGSIKSWQSAPDAEVVVLGNWDITRKLIQSFDVAKGLVTLSPPHFLGHPAIRPMAGMACYVENAIEFLDQPGEWYLDRRTGVLNYWPVEGQDLTRASVVAPVLTRLLELKGKAGQSPKSTV